MRPLSLLFAGLLALGAQAETVHVRPGQPVQSSEQNVGALVFKDPARRSIRTAGVPAMDALKLTRSTEDARANRFQRYQQYYQGLEVYGKQVVVRSDPSNQVRSIIGTVERGLSLSTDPGLDAQQALAKAMAGVANLEAHGEPKLLVYMHQQAPRLAYMAVVQYNTPEGRFRLGKVFVDANTGELLSFKTHLQNGLSEKVYDLEQRCVKGPNDLPGTFRFGDTIPADADAAERGAHENAARSYWFYWYLFERDSFDDQGKPLVASVHAQFPADFDSAFDPCNRTHSNNAFFAGPPVNQMIYGDGDGQRLDTPSAALDIVAHELSHGVTFSTSGLDYENEPGALNEAFSDIMGATVEAWFGSGGSEQGSPSGGIQVTAETWAVGDSASPNGQMVRYMNDPTRDGYSRDNYDDRITLPSGEQPSESNDFGGVHGNSGIINLAYYLLAQGGIHPQGATSSQVEGIGIESAAQVFYKANTEYLSATASFEEARYALADAAEVLYAPCGGEWRGVHQALDAVKVPGVWDPEACDDSPPPDDGKPIAQRAVVSASSEYAERYAAALVADGDQETFWASRPMGWWQRGYQHLIFDWDESQTLASVQVDFLGQRYQARSWLFYSDGSSWHPLEGEVKTRRVAVVFLGRPLGGLVAVREITIE